MWTNFKVTNFTENTFSEQVTSSPPFYTSSSSSCREGYKMCLKVDTNGYGCGRQSHVSVYAFLMRGENDERLAWPFTGRVNVELINQREDKNHYSKTISFSMDNPASKRPVDCDIAPSGYGHRCFISHSSLGHDSTKNSQYLVNDCLYFRVRIDDTPMSQ